MNLPILFQQLLYFEGMEEHPQARFIVETLVKSGFTAYYAGGWVRDFLLQLPSDDIDIATNAPPEKVQSLFSHTVPIGIAFGIILVILDGRQYEVATFRKDIEYKDGRRPSKVAFAPAIEDAKRRDFTINGMFYNPLTKEILDYVEGQKDLEKKIIRAIGSPHARIKEDRLRMIRAIRLSCRFDFEIEPKTKHAILDHAKELFPAVAIERIVQELEKALGYQKLFSMLIQLHEFHLLEAIFPTLAEVPLKEIVQRLKPTPNYPDKTPLIIHLLPLFPKASIDELIQLCQMLKISQADLKSALFLAHAQEFVTTPHELVSWAHFYAHPFCPTSLEIIHAHLPPHHQKSFRKEHQERQKKLASAILRIQNKTPLITATYLMHQGIKPGKEMGELLKLAEEIAINQALEDPALIFAQLKRHSITPKQ
jgi:poly(A) polymerase